MIKAVFFDIDGTLVSFKTHEVPPSTVAALAALREKGVKVFIATGRQRGSINNLGTLQFDGYITLNGGYCIAGNEVIYKRSIPRADIEALIRYQQEKPFPKCEFEDYSFYSLHLPHNSLSFCLYCIRRLSEKQESHS